SKLVTLSGTVDADKKWSLTLDGVAKSFEYATKAGDTLAKIAAGLADAINKANAGYVAVAKPDEGKLAITRVEGAAFSVISTVPSGDSVSSSAAATKMVALGPSLAQGSTDLPSNGMPRAGDVFTLNGVGSTTIE